MSRKQERRVSPWKTSKSRRLSVLTDLRHQTSSAIKNSPWLKSVEVGVWDGRTCQLTRRGVPGCEVAQILPAKLHGNALNTGDIDEMWYWLEDFWGEEKVSKWQDLLVEGSGLDMDRMYNLTTLDSHIHTYWNAGLVALQPGNRNEYGTEIQIALHWFPDWQELNDMSP